MADYHLTIQQIELALVSGTPQSIVSWNDTFNTVAVSGDQTSVFPANSFAEISGAGAANGTYEIWLSFYDSVNTVLFLRGDLSTDPTSGSVAPMTESVAIVGGTPVLEYETDNATKQDFDPIEISDLSQTLEIEEGVFRVDSVSVVADRIDPEYFSGYREMRDKPFMLLIEDVTGAPSTLFHGVIDPESINYNARTQLHSFEVFSWDYLLSEIDTPARSIFETNLLDDFRLKSGTEVRLPKISDEGYDLSQVIFQNDVMVIDADAGEIRTEILADPVVDGSDVLVAVGEPLTPIPTLSGTALVQVSQVFGEDGDFFQYFRILEDDTQRNLDLFNSFFNDRVEVVVTGTGIPEQDDFVFDRVIEEFNVVASDPLGLGPIPPDKVGFQFAIDFATLGESLTPGDYSGVDYSIIPEKGVRVQAGNTVRVLSANAYGYEPGLYEDFDTDLLIEALLTALPDVGVLRGIINTVNFVPSSADLEISQLAQFPENLLEALAITQNTNGTFLRWIYDSSLGLPLLDVEILPRKLINETDQSVNAAADVVEYTEQPADTSPTAIVVRPNENYVKPEDKSDPVGFYYELEDGRTVHDLNLNERQFRGLPDSERVIEIEVAMVPSYTGAQFFGDGEPIRNDDVLSSIAEQFYRFYKDLPKTGSAVVDQLRTDLIGTYVSIPELDFDSAGGRTLFVTEQSTNLRSGQTVLTGRVGEYVAPTDLAPVAKITGRQAYVVASGGSADIAVSARGSYSPMANPLTFSWDIDSVGAGTGRVLEFTRSAGSYAVELTVTDSVTGLQDTASLQVFVIEEVSDGGDTDGSDVFRITKSRSSSTGFIRMFPQIDPDLIDEARYRSASGDELPELTDSDPISTKYPNVMSTSTVNGQRQYEASVALSRKHTSQIEVYVSFADNRRPLVLPFTFDLLQFAEFEGQTFDIVGSDVFVSVVGDPDTARIVVESNPTLLSPWNRLDGTERVAANSDRIDYADTGVNLAAGETEYFKIFLYGDTGETEAGETFTTAVTRGTFDTGSEVDFIKFTGGGRLESGGTDTVAFRNDADTGRGDAEMRNLLVAGDAIIDNYLHVGNVSSPSRNTTNSRFIEISGSTSSGTWAVQDGNGRMSLLWNAEAASHEYMASAEDAEWVKFAPDQGEYLNIFRATDGIAGDPISWDSILKVENVLFEYTGYSGTENLVRFQSGFNAPMILRLRRNTSAIDWDLALETDETLILRREGADFFVFDDPLQMRSDTFVSGFAGSGFRISKGQTATGDWDVDLDNLYVRKRLNVFELFINRIRAGNGNFLFSSGAKMEATSSLGGSQFRFSLVDDELEWVPFVANDLIRIQEWKGDRTIGGADTTIYFAEYTVLSVDNMANPPTVDLQLDTVGATPTIGEQYDLVRTGNTTDTARQGFVYVTSEESGAPFIDIKDEVDSHSDFGAEATLKARLGNLSGIADTINGEPVTGYGLYSDNAFLKGGIAATYGSIGGWDVTANRIESTNGEIELDSSDPSITVGNEAGGSKWLKLSVDGSDQGLLEFVDNFDEVVRIGTFTFPSNLPYTPTDKTSEITNADMEGSTGWSFTGNGGYSTAQAHDGTQSIFLDFDSGTGSTASQGSIDVSAFAGQTAILTFWLYKPSDGGDWGNNNSALKIEDDSTTNILYDLIFRFSGVGATAGVWEKVEARFNIPTSTTDIRITAIAESGSAKGEWYFDDLTLEAFEDSRTLINDEGFWVFNSPINQIKVTPSETIVSGADFRARQLNLEMSTADPGETPDVQTAVIFIESGNQLKIRFPDGTVEQIQFV